MDDDNLQLYISGHNFRSSNDSDDVGYGYVGNQPTGYTISKNIKAAKKTKVEFDFHEHVPADVSGYALVLTKKWHLLVMMSKITYSPWVPTNPKRDLLLLWSCLSLLLLSFPVRLIESLRCIADTIIWFIILKNFCFFP